MIGAQERFAASSEPLPGGLTSGNALARGRFSPGTWHCGALREDELMRAAGTLSSECAGALCGLFRAALGGLDKWKTPSREGDFLQGHGTAGRGTAGRERTRAYRGGWHPCLWGRKRVRAYRLGWHPFYRAQERFAASSEPLLGGLTSGERPRKRAIFSRDMALRGVREHELIEELIEAAGTPVSGGERECELIDSAGTLSRSAWHPVMG